MYCKNCGKEIKDDAVFCEHCGSKQDKNSNQNTVDKKPTSKVPVISLIVVLVVIAILIGVGFSCCSGGCGADTEKETGHSKVEAWTAAQLEVERNLKSPSTADYPWSYDEYVDKIDDNTFIVRAYVDSENSFGAKVRTNFSCTVKFTGEDTYIVKDLEFWE